MDNGHKVRIRNQKHGFKITPYSPRFTTDNVSSLHSPSLLDPMVDLLHTARFFGFPFAIVTANNNNNTADRRFVRFEARNGRYTILFFKCALLVAAAAAMFVLVGTSGTSFSEFIAVAGEGGMSRTEFLATLLGVLPNIATMPVYTIIYCIGKVDLLNDFCSEFAAVAQNMYSEFYKTSHESIMKKVKIHYVLIVVAISFMTAVEVMAFAERTSTLHSTLHGLLYAFITISSFYPGIMMVSYVIQMQFFGALTMLIKDFSEQIKDSMGNECLDEHFKRGLKIENLIGKVNKLFGNNLLFDFAMSFYSLVFAAFFGLLTFTAFSDDGVYMHVLLFGIGCISWTAFLVLRLGSLGQAGQRLTDACNEAGRQVLGAYARDRAEGDAELEAWVLRRRLAVDAAVIPGRVFRLGLTSGLSAINMIITDIFVLLQLRNGDKTVGE